MGDTPLATWRAGFLAALELLKRPATAITAPPPTSEPTEDALKTLLEIREAVGTDELQVRPAQAAGERAGNLYFSAANKDNFMETIRTAVVGIDTNIAKMIERIDDRALHALGLIRSNAFGLGGTITANLANFGAASPVIAGKVESLASTHPLKSTPRADLFRLEMMGNGVAEVLLLGAPDTNLSGGNKPRAFYTLSASLRLTGMYRSVQKEKDAEYEARLRGEQRQLEWEKEAAQMTKPMLHKRIQDLERQLAEASAARG